MVRLARLALLAAALACGASALAADYGFTVERNASMVTIQRDGSVDIAYELRFRCATGARPIDIIDIGLPNRHYALNTASAEYNGEPVATIRPSEVVKCGVEIPLPRPINPGETGTLYFQIKNPHMVYQDRKDADYAGIEFSPAWYDARYAQGSTDLWVTILFPEGVSGDETRYHRDKFEHWRSTDGRIAFTWHRPQASPSRQYTFGVSFPKRYVDTVYRESALERLRQALAALWPLLAGLFLPLAALGLGVALYLANERRKADYLPPALSMEGNGVRRGLTAVEAAVLLEQPLERIAAMILFGLERKGAVRVTSYQPLTVEPTGAAPADLHRYEKRMLEIIGMRLVGNPPEEQMQGLMTDLVREVNDKVRGYNRRETAEYYRYIVSKAWREVAAAQTPEEKARALERNSEWTMADERYGQRMEDTFGREQQMPWEPRRGWWYGDDTDAWSLREGCAGPGAIRIPGREFADRLVSRIEAVARGLVRDSKGLAQAVTAKTNPPTFVPELKRMLAELSQSRGSGCVGGGCACACACASCACACAGGGR